MQEKLVIFLNPKDLEHPSWTVLETKENNARCIYDVYQGDPSDLAQTAKEKEVIVIVPSEDVLLLTANLPKMNRARLLQALPFALEDQLIDDVSELHFAASEYQGDNLPVAVIAQEKMQAWLSLLKSWDVQPQLLIPAALSLPVEENKWQIVIVDDMAIVRSGNFQGFACDKTNLSNMLSLALDTTTSRPESINIRNYSKQAWAEQLKIPVKISEELIAVEKLITDLAMTITKVPTLNFLQGTFSAKKSRFPKRAKLWKMGLGLTVMWSIILFAYPITSYFILNARVCEIDNQINKVYKRNFPNATSIIAPKIRLQEKLQKLLAKGSENRLLLLMAYVAKGLDEVPSLKIDRLDFQNNQLSLQLIAVSPDELANFTEFLQGKGLKVKQQNADLNGSKINASLVIE